MANGAQQSVASKPAADEGWQDYKPAEQGWQDYSIGTPIQDKTALSAPQPSLMNDIASWWSRRPETGGTVGSRGKSPSDIATEIGKGAGVAAVGTATAAFPTLRSIAGMIAGGKLASEIGIPEWIGAIGGGSLAGHGELPGRFGGGKGTPPVEPEPEPIPAGPRTTSSAPGSTGSLENEIAASTRAGEATRTLRGDMGPETSSAPQAPKYPLRNRYQRAAQAKREAEGATAFSRGPQSTAPAREASPVPPKGQNLPTERGAEGPDWTEEVRRRPPGIPPEQKSLRRQMEKADPESTREQGARMTARMKRKAQDAESRRQAKRGAAASESEND